MDHQDAANLRVEIQDLIPRAAALVAVTPLATPPSTRAPAGTTEPADLDRMIEQVAEVEARTSGCFADDDPSLGKLRVVLGSLYASRCMRFGQADGDRAEGLRNFRAGRAGGHLTAETDPSAMLLFVVLLAPGTMAVFDPDATGVLGQVLAFGREIWEHGQIVDDLYEMRELVDEIVAARPDDPSVTRLIAFAGTLNSMLPLMPDRSNGTNTTNTTNATNTTSTTSTTSTPWAQVRALVAGLPSAPTGQLGLILDALMKQGEALERRQALDQPSPSTAGQTQPAEDETFAWKDLAMLAAMSVPGSVSPAEVKGLISDYEADGKSRSLGIAAFGRLAAAVRTNDPREMDQALRNLHVVMSSPEAGEMSWLLTSVYPSLLSWAASTHGNRGDEAKALEQFQQRGSREAATGQGATADPGLEEVNLVSGNLGYNLRLTKAFEADDEAALERLIAEFAEAGPVPDGGREWQFLGLLQQALAKVALAVRRQDTDMAREAQAYMQAALDRPMPEAVRALMEAASSSMRMVIAAFERQPAEIENALESTRNLLRTDLGTYDGAVQTRVALASGLMAQYVLGDGPGKAKILDEAIDVLEQARDAMTERTGSRIAALVLGSLADVLRTRHDPATDDNRRAVALTRDSLGIVAGDVLLQLGAEHGLQAARAGASRGLRAAGWALEDDRIEDAIEVLELGRGLVLRATATAGTVPDRLRAAGQRELAEQWECSVPAFARRESDSDDSLPTPGGLASELSLPSDLRRRALDALRAPEAAPAAAGPDPVRRRDLLVVPTLAQIAESLDRAGLDALAYLLPDTEGIVGRVLMILRDGSTRELPLPGRGPLEHYLDTSARRYQRLRGEDTTRDLKAVPRWELSLDALCAWAGSAVVDPLIAALPVVPTPESPGRVVLVPCGQLGLVPWHAATISGPSSAAGLSRPTRACDVLVMSYAASAAELLRSLSRCRKPYAVDPVLVVDPSRTLPYAEQEALAVRHAYLPAARLMGSVKGQRVDAPGTPGQVHAALTGDDDREPASMVQIIAHGTASTRPTASRLLLARPAGAGSADGPGPDDSSPEYLTVADIVDASRPGEQDRFSSLVILDCCETDLSSRDHDEALTLTTAFVARGATDVIGSRWAVDDWAAAVCMIAFHHYLAAGDRTPADALRAAQRWMLDADREPIPAVSECLRQETQASLDDVSNWAPFIHQGNAGLS